MGYWSVGPNDHKCASCDYWGGNRRIAGCNFVEVDNDKGYCCDFGKCYKGHSQSNQGMQACTPCNDWVKWKAL